MNRAISMAKIVLLYALAAVATILILSESESNFMLILTKGIGAVCAYVVYLLCKCWQNNRHLQKLIHLCDDED